jgi:hypothetical protein
MSWVTGQTINTIDWKGICYGWDKKDILLLCFLCWVWSYDNAWVVATKPKRIGNCCSTPTKQLWDFELQLQLQTSIRASLLKRTTKPQDSSSTANSNLTIMVKIVSSLSLQFSSIFSKISMKWSLNNSLVNTLLRTKILTHMYLVLLLHIGYSIKCHLLLLILQFMHACMHRA